MSTHNLCFEQKYEEYQNFLSENFHFLLVKCSVYLNRHVFVMKQPYTVFHELDTHVDLLPYIYMVNNFCNFLFASMHTDLL